MNKNPNTKKELVNFFQGLIAVTDLQVDFIEQLSGTPAYQQKIKHHAKNLLKESKLFIEHHDGNITANKDAEKQMYSYNEIYNQFALAIRNMNAKSNDWSILLEILKAYNNGEIREAIEGEKEQQSA